MGIYERIGLREIIGGNKIGEIATIEWVNLMVSSVLQLNMR